MPDNYIIRMRETAYDLVGPFSSEEELAAWGEANQEASEDDPRWQSIYLEHPHEAPRILLPANAAPWPTSEQRRA